MADNQNFNWGITINLVNCGATAGTTSTFTSTATTSAVINGQFCSTLSAQTNAATPTTDAATGSAFIPMTPNQTCAIVFGIGLAGTLKMIQGKPIATNIGITTTPGSLQFDPQFPYPPDDFVPLAYTIVQTAPSAATWTPGSSSWAASGVTATTFRNVSQLPNRPRAS